MLKKSNKKLKEIECKHYVKYSRNNKLNFTLNKRGGLMTINMKIKSIRKEKNINQSIVADALGITVQAYSMKEMGRRPITTDELQIISQALKVSVINFSKD